MVGSRGSDRGVGSRMSVPHDKAETSYFRKAPGPRPPGRARPGCGNGPIPGIEAIRDAEPSQLRRQDRSQFLSGTKPFATVGARSKPIWRRIEANFVVWRRIEANFLAERTHSGRLARERSQFQRGSKPFPGAGSKPIWPRIEAISDGTDRRPWRGCSGRARSNSLVRQPGAIDRRGFSAIYPGGDRG
jgi:hypothetical protein